VASATKTTELAVPTTVDGLRDLLKRAAIGDTATVPAIRRLLENPENIEMFGGNLARCAQRSFVDAISSKDISVREAIHAKLAGMRKELLGEKPTAVEVLLVERIVACWLQVQDAEIRTAQAKDMTFKQADFHQRRMDATSKRYLSAIKALALVRKLAVPAFQINLAKKQVNVVASAAG